MYFCTISLLLFFLDKQTIAILLIAIYLSIIFAGNKYSNMAEKSSSLNFNESNLNKNSSASPSSALTPSKIASNE